MEELKYRFWKGRSTQDMIFILRQEMRQNIYTETTATEERQRNSYMPYRLNKSL